MMQGFERDQVSKSGRIFLAIKPDNLADVKGGGDSAMAIADRYRRDGKDIRRTHEGDRFVDVWASEHFSRRKASVSAFIKNGLGLPCFSRKSETE